MFKQAGIRPDRKYERRRQEWAHRQVAQCTAEEYACKIALPRYRFAGSEQAAYKQDKSGGGEGAGQKGQRNEQPCPDEAAELVVVDRSEERRVGKECRSRW